MPADPPDPTASTAGKRRRATPVRKPVSLALQGGGSHGAFTWGVLDRLLEEERISIEAISGTSAGAMNAVVLANAMTEGGRNGARAALHDFWHDISRSSWFSMIQRTPLDRFTGNWSMNHSLAYLMSDLLSRLASPYELNPLGLRFLEDFLTRHIDFGAVHGDDAVRLFIPATNVRTGRVRVFTNRDLTARAVMASACLPNLFPAVEINGEAYWDGGYTGNPALHPLIYHCDVRDIVIVQINPINAPGVPRTARDILDRVNEITFNSSLLAELRAIRFVARQLQAGHLDPSHYKNMLVHQIDGATALANLDASSKLNAEWTFLQMLFDKGRQVAGDWLQQNFDRIGQRSTMDLDAVLD